MAETEGIIAAFGTNAEGDFDRLGLKQSGDTVWYHFPPHLARNILAVSQKNTKVFLRYGEWHKRDDGNEQPMADIRYIRSPVTQKDFDLTGQPPPPPRPGLLVEIGGRPALVSGEEPARYFLLAGHRILLSHRTAQALLPLIGQAAKVIVRGEQRDSSDGFVSADRLPLVRARELTIDSVNYIIE